MDQCCLQDNYLIHTIVVKSKAFAIWELWNKQFEKTSDQDSKHLYTLHPKNSKVSDKIAKKKKKKMQYREDAGQTNRKSTPKLELTYLTQLVGFVFVAKTAFKLLATIVIKKGTIWINIPNLGRKMLCQKTSNSLSNLCISN